MTAAAAPTESHLVKRRDACRRLAIGTTRFGDLQRLGLLPTIKIGRNVFIRSGDLEDLIAHPERLNASPAAHPSNQD
jgi:hypothetical protein